MRRFPAAAAAFVAGVIPFQKERENPDCPNLLCAMEPIATVPEQPHALEEFPAYEVPDGCVEIPTSPPDLVRRGSKEHLEYIEWGELTGSISRTRSDGIPQG